MSICATSPSWPVALHMWSVDQQPPTKSRDWPTTRSTEIESKCWGNLVATDIKACDQTTPLTEQNSTVVRLTWKSHVAWATFSSHAVSPQIIL